MKSQNHKTNNHINKSLSSHESINLGSIHEEDEEADLCQPSGPQKNLIRTHQKFSLKDILLKFLQLSAILALIVFIFVMGYFILLEINQMLSSHQKDILQNTQTPKPLEIHLNQQSKHSVQQKSDQKLVQNQNEQQQMESTIRGSQNQPSKHQNLLKNDGKSIQETLNQQPSPSDLSKLPVYDPVLIQTKKYKDRLGSRYKQTIYIIKNTSITQAQYQRAKNLIEIAQFYNAMEKNFLVKDNMLKGTCGQQDKDCEKKQKYIDSIIMQQKLYYEQKYHQQFKNLSKQLPFCIIVPSYKNNHGNNILRNLNSIFQQQYNNFHVVYIDDASKDDTPKVVGDYIKKYSLNESKLLFIENSQNQKALKNIYTAAHQHCKLKEIMIIIDGDDYMIGTQVLRFLNFQYQTKRLLASYTNYLRINQPFYIKVGTSTSYPKFIMTRRSFRKTPKMFRASHLRSYYVDLFRKIKPEDLKDQKGQFFTAANDFAIMMPVLQMAAPHVQYLPQITYLYDSGTGLNNFQSKKQVQEKNVKTVSKRRSYDQVSADQFYPQN